MQSALFENAAPDFLRKGQYHQWFYVFCKSSSSGIAEITVAAVNTNLKPVRIVNNVS